MVPLITALIFLASLAECKPTYTTANFEALPAGTPPPMPYLGLNYQNLQVDNTHAEYVKPHSGSKYLVSTNAYQLSISSANKRALGLEFKSFALACASYIGSDDAEYSAVLAT